MNDSHHCLSGEHCRAKDPVTKQPYPTSDPLCAACLDAAHPDVRALVYDYLDLAQLHEGSLSQAVNERSSGSKERPLIIAGHVEAMQAEMVHVLATWEDVIRVAARLSDPQALVKVADWHTTISKPTPPAKVRPGHLVQRAVTILAPRLRQLSMLPATAVCPTGVEDDPVDMPGWQAVLQIADLHHRARGMLGRTRRTLALHGVCPHTSCGAEALYRQEPKDFQDEPPVWCDACHTERPYADYEHFITHLAWPAHPDDEVGDAASKAAA